MLPYQKGRPAISLRRPFGLSLLVPLLAIAALAGGGATARAQSTLTCTASAVNAVGAHAGTLAIRVAATVDCGRQATLHFTLPGGERYAFDTDASGHFQGVAGDAYLCQSQAPNIAVRAVASDGATWLQSVHIDTESGVPAVSGYGPECDVLLQPNLNFFTWGGPLVSATDGLSRQTLGNPLPRSDNSSTNPVDHISAVEGYDPHSDTWLSWFPGAPAFTATLSVLVPGESYVIRSDADIPLTYPAAGATPTPTATPLPATPTATP